MTVKTLTGVLTLAVAMVVTTAAATFAGEERVTGFITERFGTTFTMQTVEGTVVTVALTDATALKVDNGRGRWEASQLEPGLRVQVQGTYDPAMTLMARVVKFGKKDVRLATAIRAGLNPTAEQVARNAQMLGQHTQTLGEHTRSLTDQDTRIVATSGAVTATNDRIGRLDDYTTVESFTVLFRNGQAKVPAQYVPQLAELANRAKAVDGYKVSVEGFASAVGTKARNDVLSLNRAESVTTILQQNGIPIENILVPAAMGTTEQVTENKTANGQAQNRRVVVTILQNKGIAGK